MADLGVLAKFVIARLNGKIGHSPEMFATSSGRLISEMFSYVCTSFNKEMMPFGVFLKPLYVGLLF